MNNMQSPPHASLSSHRIGFVSTRFNSTDGVSLETQKWAQVLETLGQSVYYFAGQSDQSEQISFVVPEAHFLHKDIQEIANISYRSPTRPLKITRQIHELRGYLKDRLYEFIKKYDLELLIAENALSIPLNIPLGLALAELIAETGIPVIGHHHDFFWERKRFLVNCIGDYLEMAFPPRLPSIHHVVINSLAATEMGKRRGINVFVIPNVMDFDNPPSAPDEYTASLRADLGVDPDEYSLFPILSVRNAAQQKMDARSIPWETYTPMQTWLHFRHCSKGLGMLFWRLFIIAGRSLLITTQSIPSILNQKVSRLLNSMVLSPMRRSSMFKRFLAIPNLLKK